MLVTANTKLIYINSIDEEIEFAVSSPFFPESVVEDVKNGINTIKTNATHGESFVSSKLESRYITISGFIERSTSTLSLKDRLIKTINPTLKGKLIHISENDRKEIEVIAEEIPTIKSDKGLIRFTVSLQACNPFWQNAEKAEQLALLTAKLHFPLFIPKEKGVVFGLKKSLLESDVNNIGDVESGFRVLFKATGSLQNPQIYNKLTGEFIKINYSMEKDDVIEVINYPEYKKVTINGNVNGFKYIDLNTTFFNLEIGKNIIGYKADENIINLNVSMYYTPRFLGV